MHNMQLNIHALYACSGAYGIRHAVRTAVRHQLDGQLTQAHHGCAPAAALDAGRDSLCHHATGNNVMQTVIDAAMSTR